jgi:hypothetical protein
MNSTIISYLRLAIVNFIVLTILGLVLRYIHIGSMGSINYQFLLHAHSHFAFAGWMFFAIALLIFNLIHRTTITRTFRLVFLSALISAYGMLISFYLQGYKPVSIIFSTLFIVVTYRFTYLVFKSKILNNGLNELSSRLMKASLAFLCLSSIGPFALGPLMALGFKNTPYYQDSIYIYLHFQMNGFMLLAVWGLFASMLPKGSLNKSARIWADLFIYSTVMLYFIFTLWSGPGIFVQILAAVGAAINLLSWIALFLCFKNRFPSCSPLVKTAFIATSLKIVFQLLICHPSIGSWTFSNRDLIIGYIHLLTLGIITPLILDQMILRRFLRVCSPVMWTYIGGAVSYLILLFMQSLLGRFGVFVPHYQAFLLGFSFLFLVVGFALCARVRVER